MPSNNKRGKRSAPINANATHASGVEGTPPPANALNRGEPFVSSPEPMQKDLPPSRSAAHDPTPPADNHSWDGPPLNVLCLLEQHLCRIRNRTVMFGGRDEKVLKHGTAGMAGRVASSVLDYLKRNRVQPPNKTTLHEPIGLTTPSAITKLLSGQSGPGDAYTTDARNLIHFLCLGGKWNAEKREMQGGSNDTAKKEVHARIDDYFFRDFIPAESQPAVFRGWRRGFSDPCSSSEFAGEVRWYARQKELHPASNVRLVWVLGLTPFRTHSAHHEPHYANAVVGALASNVAVKFVYCDDRHPNNGIESTAALPSDSLARFLQYFLPGQRMPFVRTSLNDGHDACWWGFVVPVFQYVYLQADSDETLYVFRGEEGDIKDEERGPVAHRANRSELPVFKKWLKFVDAIK